jgi:chemotaxis protein methyltransferase CheR
MLAQEIRPLTEREFKRFQALIHGAAGIHLSDVKQALLVGRLSARVRELGLSSFGAYYDYVTDPAHAAERVEMVNRICTHETHFFREPRQFEFLERSAIPAWEADAQAGRRARRLRVWSAGCSSGEEPFSVAMSLLAHLPAEASWDLDVLATDLSTRVLDRARAATWPIAKSAEIPGAYLRRFMLRGQGDQSGHMRAGPEIRSIVRFEQLNLNDERAAVRGSFDLILCRNVLIYFDAPTRERVTRRLLSHLVPGGLLFLGHAESLNNLSDRPRCIIPTVYTVEGAPA